MNNFITAEQKAKELGATVRFHRNEAVASNFPTRSAAELFSLWLHERGYHVSISPITGEVKYTAPIAMSNIVLLQDRVG